MMQTLLLRLVIVAVIAFGVWWFVSPHMGRYPRSAQTIEAIRVDTEHHSAASQSALEEQLNRDAAYYRHRNLLIFISLLALDFVAIYFFWNYDKSKTTA
jgi:hypothetical protein